MESKRLEIKDKLTKKKLFRGENSLTKKLFWVFLITTILSLVGGNIYGFQTEFPFDFLLTPKFITIFQVSILLSFCLGFSLIEEELRDWKYESKMLLFIFFFTLLLLSTFETLLSFNFWFSVYSREGGNIDKLKVSYIASSGIFNISEVEEEFNISKETFFPPTYNTLAKFHTALLFISLFGVLMMYKIVLNKEKG